MPVEKTSPPHKLSPLFTPKSIALVGASQRSGTVGDWCMKSLLGGSYAGDVYPVNPRYKTLAGLHCYHSLDALPNPPDLAIINVASARIEQLFDQAIAAGAKAVIIFDPCKLERDTEPTLLARLKHKARGADIPVCGGNGMGVYNLDIGLYAGFYEDFSLKGGGITLIAHSGSVFTVLAHNDRRYRFNLVISAGQEIGTTTDEYIDYALQTPSTKVIALFIESVRNPKGFMRALAKARDANTPVVICKVGRNAKSAKHALTHSGAIAGDHAAFVAMCEHFGALCVRSVDELMATALLLSQGRSMNAGGLSSLSDSGGLREHWSDLAADLGVPLTELEPATVCQLREVLPFELEVDNPLDAAGPLGPDFFNVFERCLPLLLGDPGTAIASLELDISDEGSVYGDTFTDMIIDTAARTAKPFFVVNSSAAAQNTRVAQKLIAHEIPVINGAEPALQAVRNAMTYRDFAPQKTNAKTFSIDAVKLDDWKTTLRRATNLSEAQGLKLLWDFGIPTIQTVAAANVAELRQAAAQTTFPVALKTANPTIAHKSDVGGVVLDVADESALLQHYAEMSNALGPNVTLQPMAPDGIEVSFGLIADRQYGPIVLAAAGGELIELLADRVCALAPFEPHRARKLFERLAIHKHLNGVRGHPPVDVAALAHAFSRFSFMATALTDELTEVDVNPLLVSRDGCVAVDALVVGSAPR